MADVSNIVSIVFQVIFGLFEVIVLQIKFWITCVEHTINLFTATERDVSGDIVLITGAGHGMGKELALQYSELGATIVCWDINEQLNLETVKLIKSKGRKAYGFTVDVTNREKVLEAGSQVLKDVGVVTILVNNAGIMPQHQLPKHTEGEIRKIFEINTVAHFWMFEAFLPKMVEANRGHIVAMSSMAGLMGFRNLVPYCGSKFAVRGIQEALSEELRAESNGKSEIKFTTIYPYMVDTGLFKKVKIRFEELMPVITPQSAAAAIITAQRKGIEEASIPGHLFYMNAFFRLFPNKANHLIKDFTDAFVESDIFKSCNQFTDTLLAYHQLITLQVYMSDTISYSFVFLKSASANVNEQIDMADETNILSIVFQVLFGLFEVVVLQVKFWIALIEQTINLVAGKERDVSGDIVLITGAGHGMGKELALQYSALGATIVCWDINEQLNLETVKLIKSKGRKAYGYTVDVTNREKVLEAGNQVLKDVGAVTILLNNAGIMPQHGVLLHTENEIRKIFEINTVAHFWLFQAFLPKMIEANRGHIVAMSSMAGLMGFQNLVPYCGSKWAVRGIQEALSEELRAQSHGKSEIKFTTIFPYMVDTGLCKKVKIRFEKFMPLVTPEDAAAAIISAQRKGIEEASIPGYLYYMNTIFRIFPNKANFLVKDFFEAFVESDK